MVPDALTPAGSLPPRPSVSRNEPVVPAGSGRHPQADSPADTLQEALQSADEATAGATQFLNRRMYADKTQDVLTGYAAVLEEEPEVKAEVIARTAARDGVDTSGLMNLVTRLLPDDSDMIIVLRELLRKKSMDEIARKKIRELLVQAEAKVDKKAVYAGINCALKARLFAREMALNPAYLRALYRDFLFHDLNPVDLYLELLSNFGRKKRRLILDFIGSALNCDASAQDPSCSSVEFGHFLNKLNQLQLLNSAEHLFIEKVIHHPVITRFNNDESAWLQFLLSLLMNPEGLETLIEDVVGEKMREASPADISVMLVTLYNCCKALPRQLFADEEDIQSILTHFQELLKKWILHGRQALLIRS